MTDIHADAAEALKALATCLHDLAERSVDPSAGSTARLYAHQISRLSPLQSEATVKALRAELSTKSDLTDGLDQPEAYWDAYRKVESASKLAGNLLVALRRPDFSYIAKGKNEA